MRNTFKRKEKLKRKCYFDALFSRGKSLKSYPIRAIFLEFTIGNFNECSNVSKQSQVTFSVPKRRFKRAVDRNRIKRQMREAYRLNKALLSHQCAIVFVYLPKEEMMTDEIEKAMIKVLNALEKECSASKV